MNIKTLTATVALLGTTSFFAQAQNDITQLKKQETKEILQQKLSFEEQIAHLGLEMNYFTDSVQQDHYFIVIYQNGPEIRVFVRCDMYEIFISDKDGKYCETLREDRNNSPYLDDIIQKLKSGNEFGLLIKVDDMVAGEQMYLLKETASRYFSLEGEDDSGGVFLNTILLSKEEEYVDAIDTKGNQYTLYIRPDHFQMSRIDSENKTVVRQNEPKSENRGVRKVFYMDKEGQNLPSVYEFLLQLKKNGGNNKCMGDQSPYFIDAF